MSRTTGPYTVQSTTTSTVTTDKDGAPISLSLDPVTKMSRVFNSTEPTAGLHNRTGQSEAGL